MPKHSPHHTTILNCGIPVHGWILRTLLIVAKCLEWGLLAIYWANCIRFSVKRQSDGGPACCTRNVATRHLRTTRTQFVCIPSLSDMSRSKLVHIMASLGNSPAWFGIAPATGFHSFIRKYHEPLLNATTSFIPAINCRHSRSISLPSEPIRNSRRRVVANQGIPKHQVRVGC